MDSAIQDQRTGGAYISAHGRPTPPLCSKHEEVIRTIVDDALAESARVPSSDEKKSEADESGDSHLPVAESESTTQSLPARPATRVTVKYIRTRLELVFGIDVSGEAVRRALHRIGMSWKKAKKILAKADTASRAAFIEDLKKFIRRSESDSELSLVYIEEAHIHQDADLGRGWAPRSQRLYVASSSPGLSAKVTLYGIYLYSSASVVIWNYPRGNSDHTIDVLKRLVDLLPNQTIVLFWDGASYHRSHKTTGAAKELGIVLIRLPAYSPDLMPVESLWRWLRESVTYNRCHDSAAMLLENIRRFVDNINATPQAIVFRLTTRMHLAPEEEKLRFS